MQKPFPELTHLGVWADGDVVSVLPGSFSGASASRLRKLMLGSIPFPSMPKLLLSANGAVTLTLWDVPDSGYISPDAMATALTMMTGLKTLYLQFCSPRSPPDPASRPLPPPTRFVLRDDLRATFFMDPNFDLPQLHRLIGHAEEFKTSDHAEVLILDDFVQLVLRRKTVSINDGELLVLMISCKELDYQLSSLTQICSSSFSPIHAWEELRIRKVLVLHHHTGKTTWRTLNGWNFWIRLLF